MLCYCCVIRMVYMLCNKDGVYAVCYKDGIYAVLCFRAF